MKTPAQYTHDIKDLEERLTAVQKQAHQASDLDPLKNEAVELERELTMDLHAAQTRFQGRQASSHLEQQHLSGKKRGESEAHMQQDKAEKLDPYLQLKKQIQELIENIEKIAV
jgi:ABC-type dipeptide/oligopeptide/nickel transport system ATPase component